MMQWTCSVFIGMPSMDTDRLHRVDHIVGSIRMAFGNERLSNNKQRLANKTYITYNLQA